MVYTDKTLKQIKHKILVERLTIIFLWTIFFAFFIASVIVLDDENINILRIVNSVLIILASWVTIFITTTSMFKHKAHKRFLNTIFSSKKYTYNGIVSEIIKSRTVEKHISARSLCLKTSEETYIFYLDDSVSFPDINIDQEIEVDVINNFVVEIK
jgi:flagellar motor component MotA